MTVAAGCRSVAQAPTAAPGDAILTPPVAVSAAEPSDRGATASQPQQQRLSPQEIRSVIAADEVALKLWETLEQAEAKYREGASDEDKKTLTKAHLEFAERVMFKSEIPQDEKYRIPLYSYRRVLELEPSDSLAKSRIQTIVNIYYAWGKPVP